MVLFFLETAEQELTESIQVKPGTAEPIYPTATIKHKLDFNDALISGIEELVLLAEQSLDIMPELTMLVRETFALFGVKADFVILRDPKLYTSMLIDKIPIGLLPQHVKTYLMNNTFALIFVPHKIGKNPEYWPRVVHEVAHHVNRQYQLADKALKGHERRLGQLGYEYSRSVRSLCHERIADLLSVGAYGPSYVESSFMVFLRGVPSMLPTHPFGTRRLRDLTSELQRMGFADESKNILKRIDELQESKLEGTVKLPDIGEELEEDVKKTVREFFAEKKIQITPDRVSTLKSKVKDYLIFNSAQGRFEKLTPCELEIREIYALYNIFANSNSGYDNELLDSWIGASIKLVGTSRLDLPSQFYLSQRAHT